MPSTINIVKIYWFLRLPEMDDDEVAVRAQIISGSMRRDMVFESKESGKRWLMAGYGYMQMNPTYAKLNIHSVIWKPLGHETPLTVGEEFHSVQEVEKYE